MTTLLSSAEIAMRDGRATDPHPIPPITDPMGKHWVQPDRLSIQLDDTHALMNAKILSELADYTCSKPTGVYPGKMWRALYLPHDTVCPACKDQSKNIGTGRRLSNDEPVSCRCYACNHVWEQATTWWLCWFGPWFDHATDGKSVSNHAREILVA